MFYWKPLLALLLVAGFGVACAPAAAPSATPTATRIPPTATTTMAPARATEIVATAESYVAESSTPDPEILALRPDAPATGDDFRPDSYRLVASTGRPQLIEFFSYT